MKKKKKNRSNKVERKGPGIERRREKWNRGEEVQ